MDKEQKLNGAKYHFRVHRINLSSWQSHNCLTQCAEFEVLTAVLLMIQVFWNATLLLNE
jgi:hypothetical protein